jgi:hypothetical protein
MRSVTSLDVQVLRFAQDGEQRSTQKALGGVRDLKAQRVAWLVTELT